MVAFVLLGAAHGSGSFSYADAAIAPHKYNLFRWEVDNFPDKWVRKFQDLLPWNSVDSREVRIVYAQEFFDLIAEIRELERGPKSVGSNQRISELRQHRMDLEDRKSVV